MENEVKVIVKAVSKGDQDVVYSEILVVAGGIKVQLDIKSDAYAFQSYARAKVFSPTELKWNSLASLHYSEMTTPAKLRYKPNGEGVAESWFQADRDELLRQALAILA